jgi:hypothetical protein
MKKIYVQEWLIEKIKRARKVLIPFKSGRYAQYSYPSCFAFLYSTASCQITSRYIGLRARTQKKFLYRFFEAYPKLLK